MPNPPTTPEDYRELWNENARHYLNVPMIPDGLTDDELRKAVEEIAKLHDLNMRRLLREQLIDPDDFINDPKKYRDKGYRFIHETEGDKHTIIIASVLSEKQYTINVSATIKKDVGGKRDE